MSGVRSCVKIHSIHMSFMFIFFISYHRINTSFFLKNCL
nr:MAG TPA: hypothetical protein [Caudoviricetes sp.]